jgi:hypothetical protein
MATLAAGYKKRAKSQLGLSFVCAGDLPGIETLTPTELTAG